MLILLTRQSRKNLNLVSVDKTGKKKENVSRSRTMRCYLGFKIREIPRSLV